MPSKHKGRRRFLNGNARPPPLRKTTRCILPTLPPDLLQRIFRLAITFDNFCLSKALVPHTLAALACGVDLLDLNTFASFCLALRQRPALVDAVERLELVFTSGFFPDDQDDDKHSDRAAIVDDDGWLVDPERDSAGQLERSKQHLKDPAVDLTFGPYLVHDLCRLLHRVTELQVCGVRAYRDLFDAPYLEERPFPRLRALELVARSRGVDNGVFSPRDAALFANLRLIPTLRTVVVRWADDAALGDNVLAVDASAYLAPRSLYLNEVHLVDFARVGPAARTLFSALRPGLASVRIMGRELYDGIVDDLVRLPSTVTSLELVVGDDCPHYVAPSRSRSSSSPSWPRALDSAALATALPYLHHLHLSGPLVSPSTVPRVIHRLALLSCLRLGPHTPIPGAQLSSLLRGGPPTWPKLDTLTLSVCSCDPSAAAPADAPEAALRTHALGLPRISSHASCTCESCPREAAAVGVGASAGTRAPRWPEGLSAADVREVWRVARTRGVGVFGNALCAARVCGGDGAGGHRCPEGWT